VPYIDRQTDIKTLLWENINISGGNDSIVTKAGKKMIQNEAIIPQWAPSLLVMELNNVLWRETNDIQIKKLWEYLCTYCYLPRLANQIVLEDVIRTGINSTEYFAFAAAFDGNRYIDIKFNQQIDVIEYSGLLVKINIIKAQIEEEQHPGPPIPSEEGQKQPVMDDGSGGTQPLKDGVSSVGLNPPDEAPKNKRFYMSARLDNTRIGRDVQRLVEEVISHVTSADGAQAEIALEVNVTAPNGLSQQVVRTVSENCRTLKVQSFGFDE
jgi:hypothetical protein